VYYSRVEAAAYATEEVLGVARVGEEAVDERGAVAGGEPGDVDLAEHVVPLDDRGPVGSRGPEQAPSRAGDGGEPLQRRPPQRLPLVLRLPPRPRARERRLRRPHVAPDRSPPPRQTLASCRCARPSAGWVAQQCGDLRRAYWQAVVMADWGGSTDSLAFMVRAAMAAFSLSPIRSVAPGLSLSALPL